MREDTATGKLKFGKRNKIKGITDQLIIIDPDLLTNKTQGKLASNRKKKQTWTPNNIYPKDAEP